MLICLPTNCFCDCDDSLITNAKQILMTLVVNARKIMTLSLETLRFTDQPMTTFLGYLSTTKSTLHTHTYLAGSRNCTADCGLAKFRVSCQIPLLQQH